MRNPTDGEMRTRGAYDAIADRYAQLLPDTRYEAPLDLAMIAEFVDALQGDRPEVLDAGCGTGRMIGYLGSLGRPLSVSGADPSPGMLAGTTDSSGRTAARGASRVAAVRRRYVRWCARVVFGHPHAS